MRFDQYSNLLHLAAALSMAGWVARSPGNYDDFPANFNNQYDLEQNNRYHPYPQPQNNQQWGMNPQSQGDVYVDQGMAPQNNVFGNQNDLYQSKDAEETFRAYMELQELISWQESYRRGDFQIGQNNNHYVMPAVGSNNKDVQTNENLSNPSTNDDGYSTGSSVSSPASSAVSGVPSEIDDLVMSPASNSENVFESERGLSNVPFAQINSATSNSFNIDELLDLDGDDVRSPEFLLDDTQKIPFAGLLSYNDFENANSPSVLKNPGFDSFLNNPSPEYNPPHTLTSHKYDDPFSMQFTNASIRDKNPSDTLIDLGYFDPSLFDQASTENEEMLDRELVRSLSEKGNPAAVKIKQEDDWSLNSPASPVVEHNYFNRENTSTNTSRLINKHRPQMPDFRNRSTASPITPRRRNASINRNGPPRGRTFAPSHTSVPIDAPAAIGKSKKKPKDKYARQTSANFLWSDFPYTTHELVEMPVEKFQEVIQRLDDIRQHIAKDERRKGKNKLAARNCRKRKMDLIEDLDQGVAGLERQRNELFRERQQIMEETRQLKRKTEWLNNYILQHLRDSNGVPYSENEFSLQYTSDGNVYLIPSVGNNQRN